MPDNLLVRTHRIDNSGRELAFLPVSGSSEHYPVLILLTQTHTFVIDRPCDELRVLGILLCPLSYLPDKLGPQLLQELLCHLLGNRNLVDVYADLPGVAELEERNLSCRVPQVRILSDNRPVSGLSSELQRHRRQIVRRHLKHMPRHRGRSRVEDLVESL